MIPAIPPTTILPNSLPGNSSNTNAPANNVVTSVATTTLMTTPPTPGAIKPGTTVAVVKKAAPPPSLAGQIIATLEVEKRLTAGFPNDIRVSQEITSMIALRRSLIEEAAERLPVKFRLTQVETELKASFKRKLETLSIVLKSKYAQYRTELAAATNEERKKDLKSAILTEFHKVKKTYSDYKDQAENLWAKINQLWYDHKRQNASAHATVPITAKENSYITDPETANQIKEKVIAKHQKKKAHNDACEVELEAFRVALYYDFNAVAATILECAQGLAIETPPIPVGWLKGCSNWWCGVKFNSHAQAPIFSPL